MAIEHPDKDVTQESRLQAAGAGARMHFLGAILGEVLRDSRRLSAHAREFSHQRR
jgi:hypothetical protein